MNTKLIQGILAQLNESPEIKSSAVISTDGLPLASELSIDLDEDRIGAMSAAMLSLGNRSAKEVLHGELNHAIVHTNNGYMLLFQATDSLLLVIMTAHDAKLGMVLFQAKQAMRELAEHL